MEIKPNVSMDFTTRQGNKIANLTYAPIKLSILIATMPVRAPKFNNLMQALYRQKTPEVEILYDISMMYNIGVKRNALLQSAIGEYVVFIDDDDLVAPDYVEKILKAIKSGPDCIGMSGIITTNGKDKRTWHISKDFGSWYEHLGIYYRTPNHISPVRRELALKVGFPPIEFGEDHQYSMWLLPLLKTEVKIEGELYYYRYAEK
jgi:hypothetical protein